MNFEKVKNYLIKEKKPYVLEIDDMFITIEYTASNKSFNECMLDILEKKVKWADIKFLARYN